MASLCGRCEKVLRGEQPKHGDNKRWKDVCAHINALADRQRTVGVRLRTLSARGQFPMVAKCQQFGGQKVVDCDIVVVKTSERTERHQEER